MCCSSQSFGFSSSLRAGSILGDVAPQPDTLAHLPPNQRDHHGKSHLSQMPQGKRWGGQDTGAVTGLKQRDRRPFTPAGNLKSPVNLTPLTACLWTVGGRQSVRREPPHTERMQTPRRRVLTRSCIGTQDLFVRQQVSMFESETVSQLWVGHHHLSIFGKLLLNLHKVYRLSLTLLFAIPRSSMPFIFHSHPWVTGMAIDDYRLQFRLCFFSSSIQVKTVAWVKGQSRVVSNR